MRNFSYKDAFGLRYLDYVAKLQQCLSALLYEMAETAPTYPPGWCVSLGSLAAIILEAGRSMCVHTARYYLPLAQSLTCSLFSRDALTDVQCIKVISGVKSNGAMLPQIFVLRPSMLRINGLAPAGRMEFLPTVWESAIFTGCSYQQRLH